MCTTQLQSCLGATLNISGMGNRTQLLPPCLTVQASGHRRRGQRELSG